MGCPARAHAQYKVKVLPIGCRQIASCFNNEPQSRSAGL
jgi:hypothetical protein